MQPPKFTLQDVKYADNPEMFARADRLFRTGKVSKIHEVGRGYSAKVQGTQRYDVIVSSRRVDEGDCSCYMGKNDMLCKHMLALAIAVLDKTGGLIVAPPPTDLRGVKRRVSAGIAKLRAYTGPSKYYFSYVRGLSTGAGMIVEAIEALPASKENADYLWQTILRISKKLATGGIDDSEGEVGGCVSDILARLGKYAQEEPELKPIMLKYCKDDTGFGFEDDLREMLKSRK